ncbi:MAG: TIGR01777 family oxidoreductase [Bryobacteraceae bacterium]|nr:TIGR01777 family oxidoreductase [Bryobacteraceae bacterium]MDW8379404.1 TIGR01777 family oxidoreductase [Bryobacterales bacterium]
MKIVLTGASGLIGGKLLQRLFSEPHQVHVLGRKKPQNFSPWARFSEWDAMSGRPPVEALDGADMVVHLAGEPVAQRWDPEVKRRIRESRLRGTRAIVEAIQQAARKPRVFVSASAIGYYGSRGDEVLTEESVPGTGFLPEVCVAWEQEADQATPYVSRVVKLRIGIVLSKQGGALPRMLPPFQMGLGGKLGDGRMWMSWIHVDDVVELIQFCLFHEDLSGAVNATSPEPVRNEEFTRALARVLKRPALFAVPPFALRAMYGEMAGVVLSSQRVLPQAAQKAGFNFRHAELHAALRSLL